MIAILAIVLAGIQIEPIISKVQVGDGFKALIPLLMLVLSVFLLEYSQD